MNQSESNRTNMELRTLIQKRTLLKTALLKFDTYLSLTNVNITQLQERLEKIVLSLSQVEDLTVNVIVADDEENSDAHQAELDDFESYYYDVVSRAKQLLSSLKSDQPSSKNETFNESNVPTTSNFRLPTLELPKFKGDYAEWLKFSEMFKCIIDQDKSLSNIQKLHYLNSCLSDDAASVIQSLEICGSNYELAWNLLEERFNNELNIVRSHVEAIFNLEPIVKLTAIYLRKLTDDFKKHLRALKNLKEPTEHWDLLLIHIVSSKLNKPTQTEWEKLCLTRADYKVSKFLEFLEQKCKILEKIEMIANNNQINNIKSNKYPPKTYQSHHANAINSQCVLCKGDHYIFNCDKFIKQSPINRIEEVKKLKLCSNCLRPGHQTSQCRSSGCRQCHKYHNTLLHLPNKTTNQTNISQEPRPSTSSNHLCSAQSSVLLGTALIQIRDHKGQFHICRALLDNGSQCNLISANLANILNIKPKQTNIKLGGIGKTFLDMSNIIETNISDIKNKFHCNLSCLIIPQITSRMPTINFNPKFLSIPKNIQLADPSFFKSNDIDILIGAGIFWDLLCIGQISLGKNQPTIQKTKLGWVISGPINIPPCKTMQCHLTLEQRVNKFWELEEIANIKPVIKDDAFCENHFIKNATRDINGRFIVRIPLKLSKHELGDSKQQALKRFYSLENKLNKNDLLKQKYSEFINEYISLGHMSLAPKLPNNEIDFFLPHHCVINETSISTKLRVVFDGSAKSSSGISLNDLQLVGPVLQDDLFSILLRFRQHPIVLIGDITKMYRQVMVHKDDRHLQKILWRDNSEDDIKEYILNTVTYGTASASFLAIRCLRELGHLHSEKYKESSSIILSDFYVDDLITGTETIQRAITIQKQVTSILKSGGFPISKWVSNNKEVLNNISKNKSENILTFDHQNCEHKTLGLQWDSNNDFLKYSIKNMNQVKTTKRIILSITAQIFDPLGLLTPVIIIPKLIIQKLWQIKLTWDESLPSSIHNEWVQFYNQLHILNNLNIPRHVITNSFQIIEIHGFCDASEKAYGACLYIRTINKDNKITVNLLCSKSRVAPCKQITLPRLELCGALLLAKLTTKTLKAFRLKINRCFFWSDSTIALSWIQLPSNTLKTFVANRVAEIQSLSSSDDWFHVRGSENPADLISRGVAVNKLLANKLWWHGPAWLETNNFPVSKQIKPTALPDIKTTVTVCHIIEENEIFHKFSTLTKLQRVFSYVIRFINNCKNPTSKALGPLSTIELDNSMKQLIIIAQNECFTREMKSIRENKPLESNSKLNALRPFLESNILRVGGRLQNSNLSLNKKHPILLHQTHTLTKLLIHQFHIKHLHVGAHSLLAIMREKYWPLHGLSTIKKVLHKCIVCFKAKPIFINPQMGQLPRERVSPSRPFLNSGVDYAGPVLIKDRSTRSPKLVKAYICIFVCFSTKAIHLELVGDLSTEAFLASFRRFISRRGICLNIYSDNGTNFVGAQAELNKLLKSEQHRNKVIDTFSQHHIQWHFIPPKSPHMGGLWEAGVKSVKYHLKRTISNAHLSYEQFYTVLTQIEACLNSRPLCPMSNNPSDHTVLTPGHFLIGEPLTSFPEPDLTEIKETRLSRFQRCQQISQHFWKRWSQEYLTNLQQLPKWKRKSELIIKEGAIVVLKEDNLPPLLWKIGRITALHPGKDGTTRVATIKTQNSEVKRPIHKLAILPDY